jgi:hypothetical protein
MTSTNATNQNVTLVGLGGISSPMIQETPKIVNLNFKMIGDLNQTIALINRALNGTSIRGNATQGNATQPLQMQIATAALNFIKTNHTQTAPYIPANLTWTGGRVNTTLIGSDIYTFTSGAWNVTIQNPVVLNPIYNINATYNSTQALIDWQGTWQNGTVTEGNFAFNATGPAPSGSPSPSPSTSPSPSPSGGTTNITLYAGDNTFGLTPTNLTSPGPSLVVPANSVVTVTIVNVGTMPHAWALTQMPSVQSIVYYAVGSAENPLTTNQTASTTFTMTQPPGSYYYICPVDGHAALGMWGNITVSP